MPIDLVQDYMRALERRDVKLVPDAIHLIVHGLALSVGRDCAQGVELSPLAREQMLLVGKWACNIALAERFADTPFLAKLITLFEQVRVSKTPLV